jgi:hypothetical protein
MRALAYVPAALIALATLSGGAALANMCQTDHLTCATTMPIDGYCQCTSRGMAEGGTVVPRAAPHQPVNSTAGGCGSQPNSPGCRP